MHSVKKKTRTEKAANLRVIVRKKSNDKIQKKFFFKFQYKTHTEKKMSMQSVRKMCMKYAVLTVLLSALVFADQATENSDSLLSKMTWDCANNASCFNSIKNDFLHGLQQRKSFDFDGLFSIQPVGDASKPISEGRGFMSNIFADNELRIPFAGLAMTVQRSTKYPEYLELALEKDVKDEGN